ncbi:hypothetical protein PTTG_12400 [Puccinia triticina 1-1 BBBD Race 1]|uniref:Uncharacterized protein n=1 Tax=Puccinia triticina (isolate 1-1 / race 1 (BBBD)) TaxID=630390 RepID=A0A180GV58_PUCT1|nr:hypothetical protein PTTG_12400 [Puccinia triticina 1-1 BBBD Race 1]WAR52309.1 hypothetical protein PtB15_1B750 [Puccinia triticina]
MVGLDRLSMRRAIAVLPIIPSLLGLVAGIDILAPSIRTNSTATRTFIFEREISWLRRDFFVREANGADTLQVRTQFDGPSAEAFRMSVTNPQRHEFTIGLELEPNIKPQLEWCGYKQTYRTTDGVSFDFHPRFWLSDRWEIKRGGVLTEDYIWERNQMGLAGPIKDKQGRPVAHFHARTWGHEWIAMSWHTKRPHTTIYSIVTNDDIPIEYLVGLFTVAIVRMDKCGR